jgi:hypothetical protein
MQLPGSAAVMHAMGRRQALSLLAAVVAAPGCGYALAGRGSFLPTYISNIAIPTFTNRTPYTSTEELITRKVREEFIGRGKFRVVPDEASADALLAGELVNISTATAGLTNQQLASRYVVTTIVKVTFTDLRTKEVLWSDEGLVFRDEYDLGASAQVDGATFVDQQPSAVDRLATDVARTIVTAIVEAF